MRKNVPYMEMREVLMRRLRRKSTIGQLSRALGVEPKDIVLTIDMMRKEGFHIKLDKDGRYSFDKILPLSSGTIKERWRGAKHIKFGVVTDSHLGSKYQQISALETMYDIFEANGVRRVYHVGDISEGQYNNRAGHVYERFLHGADEFRDYIVEYYPRRKRIKTKFITGNHDHTFWKSIGYDLGKQIASQRDDMEYLGPNEARVMLTPHCPMDLRHPGDGATMTLSYATQKLIDSYASGTKPKIIFVGHHHKSIFFQYRNVYAFEAGGFQMQTPWMRTKRILPVVGGWIIDLYVDEVGTVLEIAPRWFPFMEMVDEDY